MTILFESWAELGRVAVSAILIYLTSILFMSLFGKRSAAKMNSFDWIVTVAMGSVLGSSVLSKDVVVLEAVVALFVLLFLQFSFTWLSAHSAWFRDVMKKSPTLLYFDGQFLTHHLRSERVTKEEVRVGIRSKGDIDESDVLAVIIEPNGEFSVIAKTDKADAKDRICALKK